MLFVRHSLLPLVIWCALLAACSGCGSSGEKLVEVRGSVTFDGAPLTTGVVSLRGDRGNNTLHQPTGSIDSRGNYRVFTTGRPGAPPGWYRVVVFATEPIVDSGKVSPGMPKSIIPLQYNNASTSPLSFEVKTDAAVGDYNLRLEKEM